MSSLLNSASISLLTELSGPGLPARAFWAARMLVSRSASPCTHSCITSSRWALVRTAGSMLRKASIRLPSGPCWAVVAPPIAPPMAVRSFMRVVSDTRQPSPTAPMRAASGTRTSVMYTSLNSASPVIWRSGRTSTPGECMSRAK